ncbi:fucose dissimilation pathway protein FucU [Hydrogenophaga crassostreae]|uniref:Fucose dissimilation pathway protein FucU n=1 Tax=Hydrogenophaga crassostreae TaxID=1763535 RepID=A0A162Z2D2_9BURK|nr:RbsD/FucU domain-containing protein [Hydrogenophaga crassostreae]AOW14683.1 fucose dissimilation pathway protein FucU [Hydrogenophaga crassostreae]OAD43220.1 fucose dissimilation pathway protein FucU [Hydrogenophaga crassostreae]
MLKGLPSWMSADLLWVMAAMGHGDRLAVVDRNYPAFATAKRTTSGRHVELNGTDVVEAVRGILALFPLDSFVAYPLNCMDPVDQSGVLLPVQSEVLSVCERAEDRPVPMLPLERFDFYEAAKECFAVVHTTESRPYGCFLLTKGVVFDK